MAGSEGEACASEIPARVETIRALNDTLRRTGAGGRIVVTAGVQALGTLELRALLDAIRRFDRFASDNDPWFEHDMGAVTVAGARYLWKIDYYDVALAFGSPDPADPAVTTRVLTIMCAHEY